MPLSNLKTLDILGEMVTAYIQQSNTTRTITGKTLNGKLYFTASYGPAAEEFLQLEVKELPGVLNRIIIDPTHPPDDRRQLVEPIRQSPPVGRLSPLTFLSEWSESRAAQPICRSMVYCSRPGKAGIAHQDFVNDVSDSTELNSNGDPPPLLYIPGRQLPCAHWRHAMT
jgi:hypothetical protein